MNPKGRDLRKTTTANGYRHISTGKPTYWSTDPTEMPNLLDFFVTNGNALHMTHIEENYDLSSDHSLVIVTFLTLATIPYKQKKPSLYSSCMDWNEYKEHLNNHLTLTLPLKTPANIL